MNKLPFLLLIFLFACNSQNDSEKKSDNMIHGNWSFLDGHGNYNEAFFGDTTYVTFNFAGGLAPVYSYYVKNDSLYSNIDKRKQGLNRIARFVWLNNDKVILITEFSKDTLDRIIDSENTLQTLDMTTDSAVFFNALKQRYENFLVAKGILTLEEIEQYKNDSIVPEDVINSLKE